MTTIYLAGRFTRKDELATYANDLEALGYTVTSRWLTGTHDATTEHALTDADLARFAREDLEDIDAADWLIFFAETPDAGYMSGGRHVEFGYALAKGKSVYVIGPAENVFHAGHVCWSSWTAFITACRTTRNGVAA